MKKKFLDKKSEWRDKMEWGDLTRAAVIAGVKKETFHYWLHSDSLFPKVDVRNLEALKKSIRQREDGLKQAIRA